MQIHNQITPETKSNRKAPFRTEPEQVAVRICQSLCPYFQREAWESCSPCPTGRLAEMSDAKMGKCWSISLPQATLRLFPSNGVIQVIRKGRKLETKTGISAFTSSDNPVTLWVDFYNSKSRPIFGITEFGSIR